MNGTNTPISPRISMARRAEHGGGSQGSLPARDSFAVQGTGESWNVSPALEAREGDLLGAARVALLDEAEWKLTNMFTAMKSFSGGKATRPSWLGRCANSSKRLFICLAIPTPPLGRKHRSSGDRDELQAVITDDVRTLGHAV